MSFYVMKKINKKDFLASVFIIVACVQAHSVFFVLLSSYKNLISHIPFESLSLNHIYTKVIFLVVQVMCCPPVMHLSSQNKILDIIP